MTPRCRKCGRPLTSPASLAAGAGPDCRRALTATPPAPAPPPEPTPAPPDAQQLLLECWPDGTFGGPRAPRYTPHEQEEHRAALMAALTQQED